MNASGDEMNEYIDINNVQFYRSNTEQGVGVVESIIVNGESFKIRVGINSEYVETEERMCVLIVDKYHRYLLHEVLYVDGDLTTDETIRRDIELPISKILNIHADSPIRVCLYYVSQNIALILPVSKNVYRDLESNLTERQPRTMPEVPSIRPQLLDLILAATKHEYGSCSNHNAILTNNNYQTIDLGDTLRRGSRPQRYRNLRQINFVGKKVMDIGANTGEISRYIRKLGADLVDGFEYDSFFVETGRMINAYTGATRVSLYQGDATHPGMYCDNYDIVVAMSVYVYIDKVLDRIADITDALILETHMLDRGLQPYLDSVLKFFPYFQHLGYTEEHLQITKSRALLLFTKNERQFHELVIAKKILIPQNDTNYYFNDENQKFSPTSILSSKSMDSLKKNGFDHFLQDIVTKYGNVDIDSLTDEDLCFFSDFYWGFYFVGFFDYKNNNNEVDEKNRFYRYYFLGIERGIIGTNLLKQMINEEGTIFKKLKLRFQDIEYAQSSYFYGLPPLFLKKFDGEENKFKFLTTDGNEISAARIDGHHRLFLAKLFGAKQFPVIESHQLNRTLKQGLAKHGLYDRGSLSSEPIIAIKNNFQTSFKNLIFSSLARIAGNLNRK